MSCLDLVRDGDVATLTIRRPEKRNALHAVLWAELREAARAIAAEAPRVLVLTGAGDHFCAGMDLSPDNPLFARILPAVRDRDTSTVREVIVELKETMEAFQEIPCPVIAAVEGACVGAGLELALSCDLVCAARSAVFALPEARLGMVPDVGGTVRLVRRIGRARATDLVLTGRRIDAEQAAAWGLVDRLVAPGEAHAAAIDLAGLLMESPPQTTRHALDVLRSAEGLSDDKAFARETNAGAAAVCTGEIVEGITSFLEKRSPRWAP